MENIYAQDADALYINLLVDSVLTDENGKTMIELQSVDEEGVMEIRCQKDQKKFLKSIFRHGDRRILTCL